MLSQGQVAAVAKDLLTKNGYERRAPPEPWTGRDDAYLFEDLYGIVGLLVYPTTDELLRSWSDDQAVLTEVISNFIGPGEPKAAEGYLVLLTSSYTDKEQRDKVTSIRYNTARVRKLVGTGVELETKTDVERILAPLLPLRIERIAEVSGRSGITELPSLLDEMPSDATSHLVKAYHEQRHLVEALQEYLRGRK